MPADARVFLSLERQPQWFDSVAARVSFTLFLLVFLSIPTFALLVNDRSLIFYYLCYPIMAIISIYLRYKRFDYLSNLTMILCVYGVVVWLGWMIGFTRLDELELWIIALLPFVLFDSRDRLTLGILAILPVGFSFLLPYLPEASNPLLPAERNFVAQMLKISVAMGAFSCVYYLRQRYKAVETKRFFENEFYSRTLNSIPLPVIIKDGITLEYIFYNDAAAMTFDLRPGQHHSAETTFSESCAATLSRLDHEVLRSGSYHIEPDECLVNQSGLTWHFRTYRIPMELKSNGRRLLLTIREDLHAVNAVLRKAEESQQALSQIQQLVSPILLRYDSKEHRVILKSSQNAIADEISAYLQFFFARQSKRENGQIVFTVAGKDYLLYYGSLAGQSDPHGVVIAIPP